jgi:hypothetical protein
VRGLLLLLLLGVAGGSTACHVWQAAEIHQAVEQHPWLDASRSTFVDYVLPGADCTDAGVIKHEPCVELGVEDESHVVLPVVRDCTGQPEGGAGDLQGGTGKCRRQTGQACETGGKPSVEAEVAEPEDQKQPPLWYWANCGFLQQTGVLVRNYNT